MNGIIKAIKSFYLDMWNTFWDNTRLVKIIIFVCFYLASTIYNYKIVKREGNSPKNWSDVAIVFLPILNMVFSVGHITSEILLSNEIPNKIFGESNKK